MTMTASPLPPPDSAAVPASLLHLQIIDDESLSPCSTALLEQALIALFSQPPFSQQLCKPVHIALSFVENATMEELNETYRQKPEPTDVLSFPLFENLNEAMASPTPEVALGDIVISMEWARDHAEKEPRVAGFAEPLVAFVLDRFVHGCLHLSGQHHATETHYEAVIAAQTFVLSAVLA